MLRRLCALGLGAALVALATQSAFAAEITGDYVESRTCDVYTGPCFANAQVGLTGQNAILAWSIDQGTHEGVDLSGLKVIVALRAADTLGFGGGVVINPYPIKSVILVDERGTPEQRTALASFARLRAGDLAGDVTRIDAAPIELTVDHVENVAILKSGEQVELITRKLGKGDCVCTNEEIFYPPLTTVDNYAPAYTIEGKFNGRGLGARWTNPKTRSAFLATFAY